MAVIRCSLLDGSLKVEEVVQFERGDTIQLETSPDAETELSKDHLFVIPCPDIGADQPGIERLAEGNRPLKLGRKDCVMVLRSLHPKTRVVKN
jgi:hypothetical protein